MIRSLFLSMGDLNKGARRPANVPATNLRKVGVLGAGLMGAGIATFRPTLDSKVVLIDRDQESADKGKAYSDKLISFADRQRPPRPRTRKRCSPASCRRRLRRAQGLRSHHRGGFEDRAVKEEATKKAQAICRPRCRVRQQHSTLPISFARRDVVEARTFIGGISSRQSRRMMLTEIIVGEKTGAKALATAMDFVRAIKKTPIVVNDCRGFYVNRCVGNYMVEAHAMVMEGVPPAMIENAPRWPACRSGRWRSTMKSASISAANPSGRQEDLGANAINPAQEKVIETMAAKEGRFGRKERQRFYDYPANGRKSLCRAWERDRIGQAARPDNVSSRTQGPLSVHSGARG